MGPCSQCLPSLPICPPLPGQGNPRSVTERLHLLGVMVVLLACRSQDSIRGGASTRVPIPCPIPLSSEQVRRGSTFNYPNYYTIPQDRLLRSNLINSRVSLSHIFPHHNRGALLSEARNSRETRERERRQRAHALVVQRSVRRWLRHVQARRVLIAELTKKLYDVEMLQVVVMRNRAASPSSSSSSSFAPSPSPTSSPHFALPVPASRGLVHQYLVTCNPSPLAKEPRRLQEGTQRDMLISLCRLVLLPGFERGGKLCGAWLEGNVAQLERIVNMLLGALSGINFSYDKVRLE